MKEILLKIDTNKKVQIYFEHSLRSLRLWESIHHKCLLSSSDELSSDEILSYIYCMCLTPISKDLLYHTLSEQNVIDIFEYIKDPSTATTFGKRYGINEESTKRPMDEKVITAEIIYYWLFSYNLPLRLENWNLNQLLTLLKVISIKNNPKKMSKQEAMEARIKLNKKRMEEIEKRKKNERN